MQEIKYAITVAVLLGLIAYVVGVSFDEDLTLNEFQKDRLFQFKALVLPRLKNDYEKQEIYLIRWLRARNFNIKAAEEMLMNNLRWRREEKMDTIDDEDWSEYEIDYPWYLDGYDNEGKPIVTCNFDEWDVRKAVLAGKLPRLMRWMTRQYEVSIRKLRSLQAEGKNVTQWDFIINMNNFNLVQHGCIACLPLYTNYITAYENYFPGMADKIMFINTPQVFEVVLNVIRPLMSPLTRNAMKVYNNNKEEWEPIVFRDIQRDQLPREYGGTKLRVWN